MTTSISDDVRVIEEALAAGPTQGPWMYQGVKPWTLSDGAFYQWGQFNVSAGSLDERDDGYYFIGSISNASELRQNGVNAALMATCDPARLRRVLDTMQALSGALTGLRDVIDAAGIANLTRGVELGPVVWSVKANDAMNSARAALALYEGKQ